MTRLGFTVTVRRGGVITIPSDIRKRHGIKEGDRFEFEVTEDNRIVARRVQLTRAET